MAGAERGRHIGEGHEVGQEDRQLMPIMRPLRWRSARATHVDSETITVAQAGPHWIKTGEGKNLERATLNEYQRLLDIDAMLTRRGVDHE